MVFKTTSIKCRQRGLTLAEFLVGLGISGIVIAQVCLVWFYSSRSFAAQISYVDLDQDSQFALDTLTRDIRQAKALTGYSTNQLVLKDVDNQPLTFRFEANSLIRIKGLQRRVLLNDCKEGSFAIFKRNPIGGTYDYYPTATVATCKLVEIRWLCSRALFPSAPETQESIQSAKIVIRTTET